MFNNSSDNAIIRIGREPSACLVAPILIAIAAYGYYALIDDANEFRKNFNEAKAKDKNLTLPKYMSDNKLDVALIGADALMTIVPVIGSALKAGARGAKGTVKIISSAGKYLDEVTPQTVKDFADSVRRFAGNSIGAVGKIDDLAEPSAIISRKTDFMLGRATGRVHNIERSKGMFEQIKKIGLWDNRETRGVIKDNLINTLKDPSSVVKELKEGRVLRESLLSGPKGHLKVESIWKDNKLITVKLKSGKK